MRDDPFDDDVPPPKPATIYDVARRANVSIKTVSKVINNRPEVSRATRARVLEVVEALAYRPNQLARGLASQRSLMLGLFCDQPAAGSGYVARIQMAILDLCHNEGYHLLVECLHAQNPRIADQVHALAEQSKLAGAILTPPLTDIPELIEALKSTRTPIARFSPERRDPAILDIDIDNRQAARDVMRYLIKLGHRRIGFVRGPLDHPDANARFEGYFGALVDAGIPFDNDLVAQGTYNYKSGMEAGHSLLALPDRPTAIFAANDDMAAGVMAASQRFDLRIPRDLSIAGFDDALFAQVVWPRLTTCRQPITQMAEIAVRSLTQKTAPDRLLLPHKIVVRGTTAPPRPAHP